MAWQMEGKRRTFAGRVVSPVLPWGFLAGPHLAAGTEAHSHGRVSPLSGGLGWLLSMWASSPLVSLLSM